jgi:multidrug transporter EmrE-like cation transporter
MSIVLRMSNRSNLSFFLYFAVSILSQSGAVVLLKFAAIGSNEGLVSIFANKHYWFALFFLALQSFFWLKTLTQFSLSLAYPLSSLTIATNFLAGIIFFGEKVSIQNLLGISIIVFGAFILCLNANVDHET